MADKPCIWCGAMVPDVDGPTHRYLESSPGCWQIYGEVLAREYSDATFGRNHRLTVDAYSVQHPGQPSRQTIQSIAVHLLSLHLVLEVGVSQAEATRTMQRLAADKSRYTWLAPPSSLGAVTVVDVHAADTAAAHCQTVERWAESAWRAWEAHHETIRSWAG